MKGRRAASAILKSCLTTIIFFGLIEMGLRTVYTLRNAMVRRVPLPYSVGDDYGPIPPWLDRMMILAPDDRLIWRSLPNVRRTYVDIFSPAPTAAARTALLRRFMPTLPREFRDNPTWSIALNAEGYRSGDVAAAKTRGTLRIACIGDSWTFGMNADQDRTYPSRLAADLNAPNPDAKVEVMNFGVLGYSSFQGLQLLKSHVLDLNPDVVAIGFGMNDSEVAGYRDRDMVAGGDPPRLASRLRDVVTDFEFYKLLNYAALTIKFHPKSMGDFLREAANDRGSGAVDYDAIEPWTRVSPQAFEANIREMIRLSRERGAAVVLLDNELWAESPYRPILRAVAAGAGVPLVDSLRLIADARTAIERDLVARLGLAASSSVEAPDVSAAPPDAAASPASETRIVFRVSRGAFPVARALSIVGTAPQLGALEPNAVLMHDDGTAGDERAGDGVWSLAASFAPGTRLTYVYTNSGARGRWEGLDIPHLRSVTVPASPDGRPVFLPVETFGRVYMQADDWHTDATGYALIARAVADAIANGRNRAYGGNGYGEGGGNAIGQRDRATATKN